MRFTIATTALLAYAGVSMANVCTLVGYTWEDQDVFSGIAGEAYGDEGFELYYQGGVHISGGTFSSDGSAFNSVAKHTIDQHYLHTAESIIWTPSMNGIAMNSEIRAIVGELGQDLLLLNNKPELLKSAVPGTEQKDYPYKYSDGADTNGLNLEIAINRKVTLESMEKNERGKVNAHQLGDLKDAVTGLADVEIKQKLKCRDTRGAEVGRRQQGYIPWSPATKTIVRFPGRVLLLGLLANSS
ncbi:hypothetical protein TRIATDRAFT_270580 [Trichoderma atroviride IMI 206040]|uniref:Uncharacterized protein n=1 Tax=Hypocrea atroviridis (strain ATCC 20476 / IMI 206040) TaxID=452589 RepID=G9NHX2_HYPAI|nr:uncharacterized protein TRIATDRAFT_270580 [Trichoderma atroviride IMI 206040]EHK49391.1 hypothetical protein TRIATDRAFT_270580 [Trichoderma atroviride IMI 206040]